MSAEPTLPALPANQRWNVYRMGSYVAVALQERRWWGWRKLAWSVAFESESAYGVRRAANRALNQSRARREIPYGIHRGGGS